MIGSSLLLFDENNEDSNVGLDADVDNVWFVLSTFASGSDNDPFSAVSVAVLLLSLSSVSPFKIASGDEGVADEVKMKQFPPCLCLFENEGNKRP